MNWQERLASAPRRLALEGGEVELLGWHYAAELRDNVPHRHTFYEVCLVGARGEAHFIVEQERHTVGPGDVFFARPGVVHQILNTRRRGMELYWLTWAWRPRPLRPHMMRASGMGGGTRKGDSEKGDGGAKGDMGKGDAVSKGDGGKGDARRGDIGVLMDAFAASGHLVSRGDGRVDAAWEAVRTMAEGAPWAGQDAGLEAAMTTLVLAIAHSGAPLLPASVLPAPGAGAGELAARAAVRYIADNLDGDLSIETLAAQLHLSARHLARVFAAFTGSPPSAYIEQARLHRASALLRDSPLPIKEIAARVGYDDVRYFSRRFGLLHGAPPAAFRRGEGHVRIIHKPGALV